MSKTSKPASSNPLLNPPHPQKRSIHVGFFFCRIWAISLRVESERVHSRGSGSGQVKKKSGEPTHSSPKSATFSKEYNTPAKSERIQFAQDTLRP